MAFWLFQQCQLFLQNLVCSKEINSEDYQNRASSLLSIASISGCCQVDIVVDGILLETVQKMYATLQENSIIVADTKSSKERAEIAREKGNQAFKENRWREAFGFYSEAIKLSDKNATYYNDRAAAYIEIGGYLEAEEDSTKAITLDEKNVEAYFQRGIARDGLSHYREALDDFSHTLVLVPNYKDASFFAGILRGALQL